jgi:hypothetical protein
MEMGDLQMPSWLQRNITPREPFDPTPWLQERYRRQIEAQKLPLQLQQMELANKAHALSMEHQGLQNNDFNQEMDAYQQDLPKLQEYVNGGRKGPPPAVFSKKGQQTILDWERADATSEFGKAQQQLRTEKVKNGTDIMRYLQEQPADDPEVYANQLGRAQKAKQSAAIDLAKARTSNYGDVRNRQLALNVEQAVNRDTVLKDLLKSRASYADDVQLYSKQDPDKRPWWMGGTTAEAIKAKKKEAEAQVEAIDKQIRQRRQELHNQFSGAVEDEMDSGNEDFGDEGPSPAPSTSAPADFEYDPRAKKLTPFK